MDRVIASIHGRFQPFHNGHLDYFRWAKAKADVIYIGVTQIYNEHGGSFPGAEHRGKVTSNPLTFFERMSLIEAAVRLDGFDTDCFRVIPFPIEDPYRLASFFPRHLKCYTTLHSEWNHHKVELLRSNGFDVEVLSDDPPVLDWRSGTEVRQMIREGNSDWKKYVPRGCRELIEQQFLDRF